MTNFDPVSYLMGQKAAGGGGGGGSSTLSGLTDVDISNPTNGQTLVYNATRGKWENGAGGGGVWSIVNGTPGDHTLTLDIVAGELYALMQNGPVVIKVSVLDDGNNIVDYDFITLSITDGTYYTFMSSKGQSVSGLASTDTVVFSQPI